MNDLTFFTNENGQTLGDRFNKIIKSNTKYFDLSNEIKNIQQLIIDKYDKKIF